MNMLLSDKKFSLIHTSSLAREFFSMMSFFYSLWDSPQCLTQPRGVVAMVEEDKSFVLMSTMAFYVYRFEFPDYNDDLRLKECFMIMSIFS